MEKVSERRAKFRDIGNQIGVSDKTGSKREDYVQRKVRLVYT